MGVSLEKGILVRMMDRLSRVSNILDTPGLDQGTDESVDDTLIDLINYAAIIRVHRKWQKQGS